jgi:hypothetical protein
MIGFVKFGKDLQIVQEVGNQTFTAFLNTEDFTYIRYSLCSSKNEIIYLDLPNRENIRDFYNVGDEVYYVHLFMLKYSTITAKVNNDLYLLKGGRFMYNTELIPYNWHILHYKCRLAIKAWLLCAKKINIYKDLRKLIASYIWRLRNEYEWECDHNHTRKRTAHKKIKKYF